MLALRWILGVGTLLLAAAWLAFFAVADGFRRSFGASPKAPLLGAIPLIVAIALLPGLLWPERRALVMIGLVVSALLCVGSLVLSRWTIGTAVACALFSGLWLFYYIARFRGQA